MHIAINNLSVHFKNVKAVDKLSVNIAEGQLVSILGPSGCGKSTTLFAIAGLYRVTAGEISFRGNVVNSISADKRGIGMVFQDYGLYPHMTVKKNIEFPLKMKKMNKSIINEKVMDIAKLVRVDDLLDRKPSQLSGGQKQRVAIARALVKEPEILLLDEPLSNLDADLRIELRREIRRIQKTLGITTLFVTHDQEEAVSISDKIILMKDGKLQQFGTVEDIYYKPKNLFVAKFLGNPKINIFDVNVKEQNVTFKDVETINYRDESITKDGNYVAGIRPENIRVSTYEGHGVCATLSEYERRGRDYLLHVDIAGNCFRCYYNGENKIKIGQKLKLDFDISKMKYFKHDTGLKVT
ncbi:ABC transporter ATP-binding protein [Clostridium sp. 'deep sea']|uniref:ABC transporter ATP-binding protein n=1 Tax=Clostridium sp. 'deep sea' TaxID=2779445 RepID=UPI0018965915|nr:ABC transporter ATP-binding protein [Clostridium sp. 'deep sea']QOR34837.1 ABC transporter ATP-binding protein [Clostridium sp. 'deep sea']